MDFKIPWSEADLQMAMNTVDENRDVAIRKIVAGGFDSVTLPDSFTGCGNSRFGIDRIEETMVFVLTHSVTWHCYQVRLNVHAAG